MAGAGYKLFNTGDVLTAQQVNEYLQQQVTMVFADATARTTALSGVLAEGMMSYLKNTDTVEVYTGSSWVSVANTGDITEVLAGTGISGGGTSGSVTITNSMATAIDAKGDLVVGTGADAFSRLAVGTNDQILVADSTTATGLKWATSTSGGVTLLSTTALSGTSTTVSSISSAYAHLLIVVQDATWGTGAAQINFKSNNQGGDSAYSGTRSNSSAIQSLTAQSNIDLTLNSPAHQANGFRSAIWLYNYNGTGNKVGSCTTYFYNTAYQNANMGFGYYQQTTGVNAITITNASSYTFSAGNILIYGVK